MNRSFGLLKFGVSAGSEIQRLVYLRVKEVAYKCVPMPVQSLPLPFSCRPCCSVVHIMNRGWLYRQCRRVVVAWCCGVCKRLALAWNFADCDVLVPAPLRVAVAREVAVKTFIHLHSLSVGWHVNKVRVATCACVDPSGT